jgi:hypothetical protein
MNARFTTQSPSALLGLLTIAMSLSIAACAYEDASQPTQVEIIGSREAPPRGKCKVGYGWDGTQCVGARVTTATRDTCPAPAVWNGSECVRP